MVALVGLAALLGVAALCSIWSGFVLTILWAWFIVPTFHLPVLTIAPAIGMAIVVGYLAKTHRTQTEGEGISDAISTGIAVPLAALGMGWVVHMFM